MQEDYIVLTTDGERVGSSKFDPLPVAGDLLVLGFPWDGGTGPYRVARREWINSEWFIVVERASRDDSAAAPLVQRGDT